ncbi:hypothetical protein V866_000472 [Kwoniella sp. B9012]
MHSEEQQHDDLVALPPARTTPVLSQEDSHPELTSSNSIPFKQITPCGPVPPQSIMTNQSPSSNTTILVGDTTIYDTKITCIPAFNTNKHNGDNYHDIEGNVSHATPSVADLTDELTICRSRIFDLEKSIKALRNENEEYRESLKYQSEEIKLLRKTYPGSSTLQSHQDHRDDDWATNDLKDYGFCDRWGMFHTFEDNRGNMEWNEFGNCDNVNSKKIVIYDESSRERIHGKEQAHERSAGDDLASIKLKLEKGLLKEKEDHLRTLSKIDKIVGLKEQQIKGLNDKLSDQQGLVAEMLDTNGALTQRISKLERQLEEDHRLRMEGSEDAKGFEEERFTGEVRAGVAGRTTEVFDAGLTDVSEDEKGSKPKYYGW